MVNTFDKLGELKRTPIDLTLEGSDQPAGLLSYPGKVLADAAGKRLFIADSSHNRIVVADLNTYQVLDVIGSSQIGAADGAFEAATFNTPQGIALVGDTLYIADMNNHDIRAANLTERTVTTVAGIGAQLFGQSENYATPALHTALSSPWDLALGSDGDSLYIAMAGTHQVWVLHIKDQTVEPLIGDGSEGLLSASFASSQLAQPSGLFFSNGKLYIADPESSSIRVADTDKYTVRTIAGTLDNNLFDFGDVDGVVGTSRLQHALGVTGTADGMLYIADTYNSRIKQLDPTTNTVKTISGAGEGGGFQDGVGKAAEFNEPGGLSAAGDRLYVADTNNGAIRVIDLKTQQVSTVQFPNPEKLQIGTQTTVAGGNRSAATEITLPAQTVAAGSGTITVKITLPDGYKINPDAPSRAEWNNSGEAIDIPEANRAQPFSEATFSLPITLAAGSDTLSGYLTTYYCEDTNISLCFIDDVRVEVPVTVSADATGSDIVVERTITPPKVDVGGIG